MCVCVCVCARARVCLRACVCVELLLRFVLKVGLYVWNTLGKTSHNHVQKRPGSPLFIWSLTMPLTLKIANQFHLIKFFLSFFSFSFLLLFKIFLHANPDHDDAPPQLPSLLTDKTRTDGQTGLMGSRASDPSTSSRDMHKIKKQKQKTTTTENVSNWTLTHSIISVLVRKIYALSEKAVFGAFLLSNHR